jgi:hypothetical protein
LPRGLNYGSRSRHVLSLSIKTCARLRVRSSFFYEPTENISISISELRRSMTRSRRARYRASRATAMCWTVQIHLERRGPHRLVLYMAMTYANSMHLSFERLLLVHMGILLYCYLSARSPEHSSCVHRASIARLLLNHLLLVPMAWITVSSDTGP